MIFRDEFGDDNPAKAKDRRIRQGEGWGSGLPSVFMASDGHLNSSCYTSFKYVKNMQERLGWHL